MSVPKITHNKTEFTVNTAGTS